MTTRLKVMGKVHDASGQEVTFGPVEVEIELESRTCPYCGQEECGIDNAGRLEAAAAEYLAADMECRIAV